MRIIKKSDLRLVKEQDKDIVQKFEHMQSKQREMNSSKKKEIVFIKMEDNQGPSSKIKINSKSRSPVRIPTAKVNKNISNNSEAKSPLRPLN